MELADKFDDWGRTLTIQGFSVGSTMLMTAGGILSSGRMYQSVKDYIKKQAEKYIEAGKDINSKPQKYININSILILS